MKRTTIFLTEALERDLQGEARRAGKPMASVVREALAEYMVAKRAVAGTLSFVGCGAGARSDVADRHEALLWPDPHGQPTVHTRRKTQTRKPR